MQEIFNQDFIDGLPDDAVLACAAICEAVLSFHRHRLDEAGNASLIEDQNIYLEAVAMFQVYTETHPLDVFYQLPKLGTNTEENSKTIIQFFGGLNAELNKLVVNKKLSAYRQNFSTKLGQTVTYQFSAEEREHVIKLIHELRVLIDDWEKLEGYHRTRLLARLGKIHGSLDRKLTDIDVVWGLLGEAYLVKAKYGSAGQLIADRINQIISTGWRAQARSEGVDAGKSDPTTRPEKDRSRGSLFSTNFS